MSDPLDEILGDPKPLWPPDPIDIVDIRAAVRNAQDGHLMEHATRAFKEVEDRQEARSRAARHLARVDAITRHLKGFLRVIDGAGNPGLSRFHGGKRGPDPVSFFDRVLDTRETLPGFDAWPVAFWRQSRGFTADIWSDPRSVICLRPNGEIWQGERAGLDQHGRQLPDFYTRTQLSMKDMAGEVFSAITDIDQRDDVSLDTTIDRAILGSIAVIVSKHRLRWP